MRRLNVVVALALAVGIALRAWVLASPLGGLDADEAVWGLMAKRIAHGDFPVFFWGQSYGGTLEAFLTAPLMLVDASAVTIRAIPLALFAVATALVWRVGRRTVGDPAARVAAAAYAVWPAYLVWKSTRAHGFYCAGAVLALLVLLLALRLDERGSRRDLAALGLVLGVGWWTTPQLAFVAVPALAWLLWRRRALLRESWVALPGLLVGAAPWIAWNARHDWGSLSAPFGDGGSYVDHLRTFFYAALPQALGLRIPFTLEWIGGAGVGRVLELASIAGVFWVAVRVRDRRLLLVVVALVYPFAEAMSPFASLNDEPRYLVLLAPVAALLLAGLIATPERAAFGLGVVSILSLVGLVRMWEIEPRVPPVGGERTPANLAPLLDALDRNRLTRVCAHYSVAYRIDFESGERIIADSTGQLRYRPYRDAIARAPRIGWAFVAEGHDEVLRSPELERAGYRRVAAGEWAVWVPRARAATEAAPTAQSTNAGGRLENRKRGCSHVTR